MTPRNADFDVRGADVPPDIFPGQRVRFSLGVPPGKEADLRRATLNEHLRKEMEWRVLQAIQDGLLSVHRVVRLLRERGRQAIPELRAMVERERAGAVPTFAEEAERYLEWYRQERAATSYRNAASRLKRVGEQEVVGPDGEDVLLDELPLDRIGRAQVRQAVGQVSSNPSTQGNLLAAVSGLFTWSIDEESDVARTQKRPARWSVSPTEKIETPDRTKRIITASDDQIRALLAAGRLDQRAYLRAFVQCGLRAGELTHTRFHHDFEPSTWTWRIQPRGPDSRCPCVQCSRDGWSPKTKRGRRAFRVPEEQAELRKALAYWIEVSEPEPGDFLFRRPSGRPWTVRTLGSDFEALCEEAEVRYGAKVEEGITLHTLRHTCITALVRAGERESAIAALVGDTVDAVVSNYVHLNKDDLARAIGRGPSYRAEGA